LNKKYFDVALPQCPLKLSWSTSKTKSRTAPSTFSDDYLWNHKHEERLLSLIDFHFHRKSSYTSHCTTSC